MIAVGLAVALAVIAGGAVLAQDSGNSGTSFLDRVAARLGVDTPRLEQAIKDARTEQIDQAVANGDLTQAQADRLKERLDNLPADAPFLGPRAFGGEFKLGRGSAFGFGICAGANLDDLAAFLGIDAGQLRTELHADGATLATVAEAHGKSRDDLKTFLLGKVKERLDEAVANDRITQSRADEIYANTESNIDDLIDRELPAGGRFKFRFGDDDNAAPENPAQRFERPFFNGSES